MSEPDEISITLSWPVVDAATGYATHLTSIFRSVIISSTADEYSTVVTCEKGYAYHQETIAITPSGSVLARTLDFVAGQPIPAPTDLQIQDMSVCMSPSKNFILTFANFEINPTYNSSQPVTELNLNGTYTAVWGGANWIVPSFTGFLDGGNPVTFNPTIGCSNGTYAYSEPYVSSDYQLGYSPDLTIGATLIQQNSTNPDINPVINGTITMTAPLL